MGYLFGVLVVEAGYRSGASLTANIAIKQGKPVFCVPSNLNNKKQRTNELIQNGAKLTINPEEIIKECNIKENQFTLNAKVKRENNKNKTMIARKIKISNIKLEYREVYKMLLNESLHINEICIRSKRDIGDISSILTMLELEGYIEQLPGKMFKIVI